ncbi:MAG: hypothetical protein LIP77_12240 [Planctomycetes bacterium]|nr:hypothetical protein [Planctomycetota bacterium]
MRASLTTLLSACLAVLVMGCGEETVFSPSEPAGRRGVSMYPLSAPYPGSEGMAGAAVTGSIAADSPAGTYYGPNSPSAPVYVPDPPAVVDGTYSAPGTVYQPLGQPTYAGRPYTAPDGTRQPSPYDALFFGGSAGYAPAPSYPAPMTSFPDPTPLAPPAPSIGEAVPFSDGTFVDAAPGTIIDLPPSPYTTEAPAYLPPADPYTPGSPFPPPADPVSSFPAAPEFAAPAPEYSFPGGSPTPASVNEYRLVPALDVPPGIHPNDAAPSQWYEVLRPGNGPIRIGRVSSTCVCVGVRVPNRHVAAGERALIEARTLSRTPVRNVTYGLYVNIMEPDQLILDADILIP